MKYGISGEASKTGDQQNTPPAITFPKGGGALRGMGEKFSTNPVTGTGSLAIPIYTSPGRSQFYPKLSIDYNSGSGNGAFGLGWSMSVPFIARKTDKRLPKYLDAEDSDVFILSGAEDLVPVLIQNGGEWTRKKFDSPDGLYTIERYRPRVEALFARIEKWQEKQSGQIHWRSVSKDNVTSIYGKSDGSKIFDPKDGLKIFKWLLEESVDDKGNVIIYEYKNENLENVGASLPNEKNRLDGSVSNVYLKRIHYGNEKPFERGGWLFEIVFDYGEHDLLKPEPQEVHSWLVRPDAFSQYRAGFEIRTWRLCRRILVFHRFPELGPDPYLVRSTAFQYNEEDADQAPVACYLKSVMETGYVKDQQTGNYKKRSLPSLEFEYSQRALNDEIRVPENIENLSSGLPPQSQWLDLNGTGISGILTEAGDGWFYKQNLSNVPVDVNQGTSPPIAQFAVANVQFAPLQFIASKPSASLKEGEYQFQDLAGDGQMDLVSFHQPLPGFYERDEEGGWTSFTPFESSPHVDWNDPNLRFVDLTGDGHPDILISKDDVFVWYASTAEKGFDPPETILKLQNEEEGPRLIFADLSQSIYLADMSGGGMTDIVRIRNNEVCYWPNLGYGRFGRKVTMDRPPQFDHPDLFQPNQMRLADIDGSGTTDILYFGRSSVSIWFNQAGNSFSGRHELLSFPASENFSNVSVFDLLGNGTACILWTSPLPDANGNAFRYIDLMNGVKPHLMNCVRNNMGTETRVVYTASTKFYLQDLMAGAPWITNLPFPVQVIERTEAYDSVNQRKLVTLYRYHHGYFDAEEREFRGFGYVEQWDTEFFGEFVSPSLFAEEVANANEPFHAPPIYSRSWFHTGFFLNRETISHHFVEDYYREPQLSDDAFEATLLPDTDLPANLSLDEEYEACRALKGNMLRQEIYAVTAADTTGNPYAATEYAYKMRLLQPQQTNKHAVFYTYKCETLNMQYERTPEDPRVSHELALEVDEYGNVTKSVAIHYPRRNPLFPEQEKTFITYSEDAFANQSEEADWYRIGLMVESKLYELTGFTPSSLRFSASDFLNDGERRLLKQTRSLYYNDALSGAAALGIINAHSLVYQTYKLAFTDEMLSQFYGNRITEQSVRDEGKYIKSADYKSLGLFPAEDPDDQWWAPSSRQIPDPTRFYLTTSFINPFLEPLNLQYEVTYDDHALLMTQVKDPLGNRMTVGTRDDQDNVVSNGNDYRVLQPALVTDANRNQSAAAFDSLGNVVGIALTGRTGQGDSLQGFEPDLESNVILEHLTNPLDDPHDVLGSATSRILYDFYREGRPNAVYSLSRVTHQSELEAQEESGVQHIFIYSDGGGRSLQMKVQAEPGEVDGVPMEHRWVGTGTAIYNNKGKVVRKHEPFFDDTHVFHQKQTGVSSTIFYDPIERVVATLHPEHTYEKVVMSVWRTETWDLNDTIHPLQRYDPQTPDVLPDHTFNPIDDPDVGEYFERLPEADYLPTWYHLRMDPASALSESEKKAARKAAKHASTPTVVHLDPLARRFLTIADNGDQQVQIRVELDIENNPLSFTDALQRKVVETEFDMLGTGAHTKSLDAGEIWVFKDINGRPVRTWNIRGIEVKRTYDALQRPEHVFVRENNGPEILAEKIAYGESNAQAVQLNLRGRAFQQFDSAGIVTNEEYDFKGNLVKSTRQFLKNYKELADWSTNQELESEIYRTITTYNALNEPLTITTPDQSVSRVTYNESTLIEKIDVQIHGGQETSIISNIEYDAKGQRLSVAYGNGVQTKNTYDPLTFRIVRLETTDQRTLQDLSYFYDPVGNVSEVHDDAQQSIYFANTSIAPHGEFEYDALYQLIAAEGREHIGQISQPETTWSDEFRKNLPHPNDGNAMRRYVEKYTYDLAGNILNYFHHLGSLELTGQKVWGRDFIYGGDNRLSKSIVQRNGNQPVDEPYTYDASGNVIQMLHLSVLAWDYADRLERTAKQVVNNGGTPETTFYVYDAAGQRVRKITERQADAGETPSRKSERMYFGGFEIYREYDADGLTTSLERETLQIMDDSTRVALIESRTKGTDDSPPQVIRFQFGNHLGSASLELDEQGQIITYEEYYPFGGTSFQSGRSQVDVNLKRYRYSGKERDEENGFYYHGARYYAPWLGRWTSTDPAGLAKGLNLYCYCRNNPVRLVDPDGQDSKDTALLREELKRLEKVVAQEKRLNQLKSRSEYKNLDQAHQDTVDKIINLAMKNTDPDKIKYYADKLELLFNTPHNPKDEIQKELNESSAAAKKRLATKEGLKSYYDEEKKTKDPNRKWTTVENKEYDRQYRVDASDPTNVHVHIKVKVNVGWYWDFSKGEWAQGKLNFANVDKVKSMEDDIEKQAKATKGYSLDLEFVTEGGKDVFEVGINPQMWTQAMNWAGTTLALTHELHHLLGLDDRYNYIEQHADNETLSVEDRVEAFLYEMEKAPDPLAGRPGLMATPKSDQRLLDAEVCKIEFPGQDALQGSCVDARRINP